MNNYIFEIVKKIREIELADKNKKLLMFLGSVLILAILLQNMFFLRPENSNNAYTMAASYRGDNTMSLNKNSEQKYEVFGFAPWWNINKLGNVDFNTLTTLAYFGASVGSDGNIDTQDEGYTTYYSDNANNLFQKAHQHGAKVVLTLTNMENSQIEAFLDNPEAQNRVIEQTKKMVQDRGIDGVNIDFEYSGDPGQHYKDSYTQFVKNFTQSMHQANPDYKVTVSVYASAARTAQLYDIGQISANSDGIFMMAYDYATTSSDNAIPTAPLYGYKTGQYWYDVSTAVEDFLKVMPAEKLILGVPWYGYDYGVSKPEIKAATWGGSSAQTYADVQNSSSTITGWDDQGAVGWKASYDSGSGVWRMIFIEDTKSLSLKYDFAKSKGLKGVGIWALGMDDGRQEMWSLLSEKFGEKNIS